MWRRTTRRSGSRLVRKGPRLFRGRSVVRLVAILAQVVTDLATQHNKTTTVGSRWPGQAHRGHTRTKKNKRKWDGKRGHPPSQCSDRQQRDLLAGWIFSAARQCSNRCGRQTAAMWRHATRRSGSRLVRKGAGLFRGRSVIRLMAILAQVVTDLAIQPNDSSTTDLVLILYSYIYT
jgi:hypothetical protein